MPAETGANFTFGKIGAFDFHFADFNAAASSPALAARRNTGKIESRSRSEPSAFLSKLLSCPMMSKSSVPRGAANDISGGRIVPLSNSFLHAQIAATALPAPSSNTKQRVSAKSFNSNRKSDSPRRLPSVFGTMWYA